MNKIIFGQDLELLSSYLDDQLSPSEQKLVEKRLESDSAYKQAFEKLQRTRLILRTLPQRAVPRNFTLSAEVNKKRVNIPSFFQIVRFSSAVAVLGLVILLVFDFLPSNLQSVKNQKLEAAQAPAAAAPAAKSNEPPMIIIWSTPQSEVLGKGGGGGNDQAGAISSYAIPQSTADQFALRNEKAISPAETLPPQSEEIQASPTAAVPAVSQTPESKSSISGTGPILGIPPSNERGIIPTLSVQPSTTIIGKGSNLRVLEVVLGALAILTGITAFLLSKKQF